MAQRIDTQYCGLNCARKAYKLTLRDKNIWVAQAKNKLQQGKPSNVVTEEQIKIIQSKEYLTLKEAAMLLNVSTLTLRRWILSKQLSSTKINKKHLISRKVIDNLIAAL